MTFYSSLKYALSLIFPRTEKASSGHQSLLGASICIGISIIPLIIVLCVTNGMIDGMTQRIIGLSSGHLQAYVSSGIEETSSAANFCDYAQNLKSESSVKNAFPEAGISALAAANNFRSGIQIRGMKADVFEKNQSFRELFSVKEGDKSSLILGDKSAIIGEKLAENLKLHPGDTVRVITTKSKNGVISPKMTSFKVLAIVSSGYQELDALWFFVSMDSFYSYLPVENASFTIMMEMDNPTAEELLSEQHKLQKAAGRYANIYRWNQLHTSEYESFNSTKLLLVFVMFLIVLVATVNISSAIVMLVMERRKEIGILKSMGATDGGITMSFMLTGLFCGLGGIIAGVPCGILLSVNINGILSFVEKAVNLIAAFFSGGKISEIRLMDPAYYLQVIPVELPFHQIFIIVLCTLLLSLLVSILPSVKAGKERIIDILRKN